MGDRDNGRLSFGREESQPPLGTGPHGHRVPTEPRHRPGTLEFARPLAGPANAPQMFSASIEESQLLGSDITDDDATIRESKRGFSPVEPMRFPLVASSDRSDRLLGGGISPSQRFSSRLWRSG